jgi:hypothetical protein
LGGVLPAVFAKSSMLWSSVYYVYSNKNIKKGIFSRKPMLTDRSNANISESKIRLLIKIISKLFKKKLDLKKNIFSSIQKGHGTGSCELTKS